MSSGSLKPSGSFVGPLLVLVAGGILTIGTGVNLYMQLRFVFFGHKTDATVTRKQADEVELTFTDADGQRHVVRTAVRGPLAEGDTVPLRYLTNDAEVVRLEDEVHSSWRWAALWCVLALGLTGFGVLLMWGQRPDRRGGWRGKPGEW